MIDGQFAIDLLLQKSDFFNNIFYVILRSFKNYRHKAMQ